MRKNPIIEGGKRAHNFRDILGQRFGRLLVTAYAGREIVQLQPKIKYKAVWHVLCDCGNKRIMRSADLGKSTVSCGCYSREQTITFNIKTKTKIAYDTFSVVWQSYRRGAAIRDLSFELTKDQFYDLTQQNCDYCGKPPLQCRKARVKGKLSSFIFNGIDRVDSSVGYIPDNCVPCCKVCNLMKMALGLEEFKAHIVKVYHHFASK